eukprot:gene7920-10717_t
MTAWAGLLKVAALKDGDVVFVSGAAGAVGSVVVQIAKIKGHKVIGSAGGAEKVAFLKSLGCDEVIDYKAEKDLTAALMKAAPTGIDVYFENVGGEHMDAAGVSREDSYRLVQRNAMKVWESDGELSLLELLKADPEVTAALSVAELEDKFDLAYHLKHVDTIFARQQSPHAPVPDLPGIRKPNHAYDGSSVQQHADDRPPGAGGRGRSPLIHRPTAPCQRGGQAG